MNPEREPYRMSASGRVCPEADSIRVELAPAVHIARARERFGDVQIVLPPAFVLKSWRIPGRRNPAVLRIP
jgi:hypothetical protein